MLQVCHSQAWNSKIVTSAWWVYPHQVSKTAPTGEYLTVGSFMIRGKKNFLPPHPLVMGFALLFRLDESSLGSHLNERRVRGEEEGMDGVDESGPVKEESDTGSEAEELAEELKSLPDSSTNLLRTESLSGVESTQNDSKTFAEPINSYDLSTNDSKMFTDVNQENVSDVDGDDVASVTPQLEDLLDRALELGSATTSGKTFKVETSREDLVEEHDHEENKAAARDKPYISKAERRKLKKGQKNGTENVEHKGEKLEESKRSSTHFEKHVHDAKPVGGKISRGQKSKLKKMKEKYADQDEEERSIRMALLAVSTMTCTILNSLGMKQTFFYPTYFCISIYVLCHSNYSVGVS